MSSTPNQSGKSLSYSDVSFGNVQSSTPLSGNKIFFVSSDESKSVSLHSDSHKNVPSNALESLSNEDELPFVNEPYRSTCDVENYSYLMDKSSLPKIENGLSDEMECDVTKEEFPVPAVIKNLSQLDSKEGVLPQGTRNTSKNLSLPSYKDCKREVRLYSPSTDFCHTQKLTAYVKGVERDILKDNLLRTKPSVAKRDALLTANKEISLISGNLQKIKSDCVFRKARSEAKSQLDRHIDDVIDLIFMQSDHSEYIREVAFSFSFKMFSWEQLSVIDNEIRITGDLPILHFDAIGSVVRKPLPNIKHSFSIPKLYKLLIQKEFATCLILFQANTDRTLSQRGLWRDGNNEIERLTQCSISQFPTNVEGKPDEDDLDTGPLYRNSSFFTYFNAIFQRCFLAFGKDESSNANPYYNSKLLNVIITKYMPYLPLWSAILLKTKFGLSKISNAPVENFFGNLKHHCLNDEKNWKCFRFSRKLRERPDSPGHQLLKEKTLGEKRKKAGGRGKAQANLVVENPDVGLEKCRYCARRRLDVTADWVACDRCESWIHLSCEDHTIDLEGTFTCQACRIPTMADMKPNRDESVATKCKNYLETLTLSVQDIYDLEERTRGQSQTSAWHVERKKRITASNMGKVCKARNHNSRLKLAESILSNYGSNLDYLPPIKHGKAHEEIAIR
ncbi:hypothetical protein ILUMI_01913 [Ignelater luminosus]|uniref:PHD-type domain-containing protein n=1 Tax=Ignelater luminosus TaxID=2038154 RepID=A0A8K0DDI8_IGNLU|nr:hypothetical protein ILUMI_01913 [Ignelater luminosus]